MRKKVFLCSLALLISIHSIGQPSQSTEILTASRISVPPGPNASSLGKYADIPVSYYSGLPSISVPLYVIETKSLKLPISLNYHASGVRVNETASWVGLGWSLSGGGSISRTVRGADDFKSNSFQNSPYSASDIINSQVLTNLASKAIIDSQPDIFYYSLPGESSKFFPKDTCTFDRGNCNYCDVPLTGKSIQFGIGGNEVWRVVSQEGVEYYYGIIGNYGGVDVTNSHRVDLDETYVSAWHLAKIVSPNKNDSILFEYESESFYYSDGTSQVSYSYSWGSQQWCYNVPGASFASTGVTMQQSRLSKITATNLTVFFDENLAQREDLPGSYALEKITIATPNASKIYKLDYSYFDNNVNDGDPSARKRLRLETVTESAQLGNETKPPFRFYYNTETLLPPRGSFQQDHWGFHNSNPIETLVPKFPANFGHIFFPFEDGGSRDADSIKSLSGILKRMVYPTGGFTEFEYETHDYSMASDQSPMEHVEKKLMAIKSNSIERDTTFTLLNPTTVKIVSSIDCRQRSTPDPFIGSVSIQGVDAGVYSLSLAVEGSTSDSSLFKQTYQMLPPGTYSLVATISDDLSGQIQYTAEISLTFFEPYPAIQKRAGGARIKKITDFDDTNGTKTRLFEYKLENGFSSGVLVATPNYIGEYETKFNVPGAGQHIPAVDSCGFMTFNSISNTQGVTKGSHIGYKRIVVRYGLNGENGSSIYKYTSADEYPNINGADNDYQRGLLTSETHFDAFGKKVKKTDTHYNVAIQGEETFTKSYKIEVKKSGASAVDTEFLLTAVFDQSSWLNRSESTDSTFNGGKFLVTNEILRYTNSIHKLPTIRQVKNSTNEDFISITKFPGDMPSSDIYNKMVFKNMSALPVEIQTWKKNLASDSVLISSKLTDYSLEGNFVYPFSEKSFLQSAPVTFTYFITHPQDYEVQNKINAYDDFGNIIEYETKLGVKTVLVWGYSHTLLSAQIIGASLNQVYHNNFEEEGNSGNDDSRTGHKSYVGTFSKILTNVPVGTYHLTYWAKTTLSSPWVQVTNAVSQSVAGSYTINLSGYAQVDDVRFYPQGAQMVTQTYDPGIGVTSKTDANGVTTYYLYDKFWRLQYILNEKQEVVKKIEYNYKQNGY